MPFIVTPDQVAGLQRNVNVEVESLYRDIITCSSRLPENFKTTWRSFASSWSIFYRDNSSTVARMWGNTWDMTQGYATLILKWRSAFEAQCGRPPTSPSNSF